MKLWIDDVSPAPEGYVWFTTVHGAIAAIANNVDDIEIIDIDHDAGDASPWGGDYIRILDWLEETGRNYPIRIHSMNPVGRENMRAIIKRNGWTEVM